MIKDRFSKKLQSYLSGDEWIILQDEYNPDENLKYETIFGLTNGYMGTRGGYEEGSLTNQQTTFINGVFDKSETFMRELANLQNWLGIRLYATKQLIGIDHCKLLEFSRVLDMKNALLAKHMIFEDKHGRQTLVEGIRFLSRANVHRGAVKLFVTPLNYSEIIEVENIIDGSTINFADAPRFKVKHMNLKQNIALEDSGIYLESATRDRDLYVGLGTLISIEKDGKSVASNRQYRALGEQAVEFWDYHAQDNVTVEITKYASYFTERDIAKENLLSTVKSELSQFIKSGFDAELDAHIDIYSEMWKSANIEIGNDFDLERAIRFNIFQLMSTGNEHDNTVNVGAKLLHGEEYGGHAFWDTELFMLPFFAHTFPKVANNLVNYRYNLLQPAKNNAEKNGYKGAQYPWESADDGTEQCPDWTIEPNGSMYRCYVAVYEHHVTAAVAHGIYNYVKITQDYDFLYSKGLEILVETARFWSSRCEFNEDKNRYEIRKVTGPDEWHEPVDNNLYTNYLARWNLVYVRKLLQELRENQAEIYSNIIEKLSLTDSELQGWKHREDNIYLPKQKNGKIFEQFEGYFDLIDVTIDEYDANDWPIRPQILNDVDKGKTQILKQPDVVMLMHLMTEEFDEESLRENYDYYEKRTLHGSSLSPSIYSIMGLKVGDDSRAYRYLRRAAFIDLLDLQKNTREGIHAANAGGVWQTVVFGFAGVAINKDGVLTISPKLPKEWSHLKFRIKYAGAFLDICIENDNEVTVKLLSGNDANVVVNGQNVTVG